MHQGSAIHGFCFYVWSKPLYFTGFNEIIIYMKTLIHYYNIFIPQPLIKCFLNYIKGI